jgi:hypothetical protein
MAHVLAYHLLFFSQYHTVAKHTRVLSFPISDEQTKYPALPAGLEAQRRYFFTVRLRI